MFHNKDARLIHFVWDNCDFVAMWLLAYMFLTRGSIGWSVVGDGGISWSTSSAFCCVNNCVKTDPSKIKKTNKIVKAEDSY